MTVVFVRLTPKAAQDRIDGWGEDDKGRSFLKIRLTAPPIEGKANAALVAFLAKALRLPKSDITLLRGDTSRLKSLEIEGLSAMEISERLG